MRGRADIARQVRQIPRQIHPVGERRALAKRGPGGFIGGIGGQGDFLGIWKPSSEGALLHCVNRYIVSRVSQTVVYMGQSASRSVTFSWANAQTACAMRCWHKARIAARVAFANALASNASRLPKPTIRMRPALMSGASNVMSAFPHLPLISPA